MPSIYTTQKKLKITLGKINKKLKETKDKKNRNSKCGTVRAIETMPQEFWLCIDRTPNITMTDFLIFPFFNVSLSSG